MGLGEAEVRRAAFDEVDDGDHADGKEGEHGGNEGPENHGLVALFLHEVLLVVDHHDLLAFMGSTVFQEDEFLSELKAQGFHLGPRATLLHSARNCIV